MRCAYRFDMVRGTSIALSAVIIFSEYGKVSCGIMQVRALLWSPIVELWMRVGSGVYFLGIKEWLSELRMAWLANAGGGKEPNETRGQNADTFLRRCCTCEAMSAAHYDVSRRDCYTMNIVEEAGV